MMSMILRKHQAAKENKKKGFTLIEVIVVIVIIAILAAIAVPSLTRYIGTAEKRGIQSTAHNIQLVLQAEKSNQNFVPFTGTTGSAFLHANTTVTYNELLEENGIILKEGESLTGIVWGGAGDNTLQKFTFTGVKYSIEYDITLTGAGAVKGFQEVKDNKTTTPPTA